MKAKLLFFIRHGSTYLNEDSDRFCGSTDPSLSPLGIAQIERITLELKELKNRLNIDQIITSPLKRAVESAQILSRELSFPYKINPDIREIDFGEWERLTKFEVNLKYPKILQLWLTRPDEIAPPGGENPYEVVKRAIHFQKQEIEKSESLLIVSHKTFLRIALSKWLSIPLKHYRNRFDIHFGALGCIRFEPGASKLVLLNWAPNQSIQLLTQND
ncbi:MAG: histidine phosphatase family protein [Candidatus Aminicenantes bacterium]|nr:MAG: histidine phosphatase family protein [Candidatus Aminicenantes bacterium]